MESYGKSLMVLFVLHPSLHEASSLRLPIPPPHIHYTISCVSLLPLPTVTTLYSNLTPIRASGIEAGTNISFDSVQCYTVGKICILNARLNVTGNISAGTSVLVTGLPKAKASQKIVACVNNGNNKAIQITSSGNMTDDWAGFTANTGFFVSVAYPTI